MDEQFGQDAVKARRVTLLSNRTALMGMVELLLAQTENIELSVVALDSESWQSTLLAARPHSVVVDAGSDGATWKQMCPFLYRSPIAKLIALQLDPPKMNIFTWEQVPGYNVSDLMSAICVEA